MTSHFDRAMLLRAAGLALIASCAAVAEAAPGPVGARDVAAAAERCGLRGLTVDRTGRRRFSVAQPDAVTTVSVEGPVSPERERELQAESEAAIRPWNCLQLWARRRGVIVDWPPPPLIILD